MVIYVQKFQKPQKTKNVPPTTGVYIEKNIFIWIEMVNLLVCMFFLLFYVVHCNFAFIQYSGLLIVCLSAWWSHFTIQQIFTMWGIWWTRAYDAFCYFPLNCVLRAENYHGYERLKSQSFPEKCFHLCHE